MLDSSPKLTVPKSADSKAEIFTCRIYPTSKNGGMEDIDRVRFN